MTNDWFHLTRLEWHRTAKFIIRHQPFVSTLFKFFSKGKVIKNTLVQRGKSTCNVPLIQICKLLQRLMPLGELFVRWFKVYACIILNCSTIWLWNQLYLDRYGAPAGLFCGPRSVYPFTSKLKYHRILIIKSTFLTFLLCIFRILGLRLLMQQSVWVYKGQKAWRFDNTATVANSAGRTDVEGCCWYVTCVKTIVLFNSCWCL